MYGEWFEYIKMKMFFKYSLGGFFCFGIFFDDYFYKVFVIGSVLGCFGEGGNVVGKIRGDCVRGGGDVIKWYEIWMKMWVFLKVRCLMMGFNFFMILVLLFGIIGGDYIGYNEKRSMYFIFLLCRGD